MKDKYNKAREILKKYNQDHVIQLLKFSNGDFNNNLIEQVLKIDFEEIKNLYNRTFEKSYVDLEEIQPIAGVNPDTLSQQELETYEQVGIEIIKNNKFAVSTMAGGQGTRLRS